MRKLLLALSLPLICANTYAQSNVVNKSFEMPQSKRHGAQSERSASKPTAVNWRLSSYSYFENNGTSLDMTDTGYYKYTNGRGSSFDYNEMYPDDEGILNKTLSDTIMRYSDAGSGIEPSGRSTSEYDANNNRTKLIIEELDVSTLVNSEKYDATYDNNGNLTVETESYWDDVNNVWDKVYTYTYTYNTQNKMIADSSYDHDFGTPDSKIVYTYDGNGNEISSISYNWNGIGWDTAYKYDYTYYTNNKLKTSTFKLYNSGVWENSYMDSSGYSNTDFYTYYRTSTWDDANSKWIHQYRETRTLGSNNLPDMQQMSTYDTSTKSWSVDADVEWSYNSNNDPVYIEAYAYIMGVRFPSPIVVANLYYESYFNVGVEQPLAAEKVSVYPNPATDVVNIDLNGKQAKEVSIYSTIGRKMYQSAVNNQNSRTTVPVSHLPNGNYIINVTDADGKHHTQQISKQ